MQGGFIGDQNSQLSFNSLLQSGKNTTSLQMGQSNTLLSTGNKLTELTELGAVNAGINLSISSLGKNWGVGAGAVLTENSHHIFFKRTV